MKSVLHPLMRELVYAINMEFERLNGILENYRTRFSGYVNRARPHYERYMRLIRAYPALLDFKPNGQTMRDAQLERGAFMARAFNIAVDALNTIDELQRNLNDSIAIANRKIKTKVRGRDISEMVESTQNLFYTDHLDRLNTSIDEMNDLFRENIIFYNLSAQDISAIVNNVNYWANKLQGR